MLRPRVVGEWVGREEEDADPLAAEMLRPPVPRAKTEVCWSGDSSPAGRLVVGIIYILCVLCLLASTSDLNNKSLKLKKFSKAIIALNIRMF